MPPHLAHLVDVAAVQVDLEASAVRRVLDLATELMQHISRLDALRPHLGERVNILGLKAFH